MKNLAASREVSTPRLKPQICNLLYAASDGEMSPKKIKHSMCANAQTAGFHRYNL